MTLHYRRTLWILLYISVLSASLIFICSGCATRESVTRREKTETRSVETPQPVYPGQETTVQTTTETDTEHSESEEHHGVLSSAVHFIGAVLAFPFKVIAAAIGAIF